MCCALGLAVSGCASSGSNVVANPAPATQGPAFGSAFDRSDGGAQRFGPSGSAATGKKATTLLYVSNSGDERIDVFSLPKYHRVGKITNGINQPTGIAIDEAGNLYVSSVDADTVTIYKHGKSTPSLTLTGYAPEDVAVAKNGDVLAGGSAGVIDVYEPGAKSPSRRLTNPALAQVFGVAVDGANNVYAAGYGYGSGYSPVGTVVRFAKISGPGKNLGLTGLRFPIGVLVDAHGNIVVSDYDANAIKIFPPEHTSASATISVTDPEHFALNGEENQIFVAQGSTRLVSDFTYPGGLRVSWKSVGGFTDGTALYPAAKP